MKSSKIFVSSLENVTNMSLKKHTFYFLLGVSFLLYSCSQNNEKANPQKEKIKQFHSKIDTLSEPPFQQSDCFLKLKNGVIKVKDSTLQHSFANVLIQYNIRESKITGNVHVAYLVVFRNSDKETIYDSIEDGFDNKQDLLNAICVEAKKNLVSSTLSCRGNSISSWGRIIMRVVFI